MYKTWKEIKNNIDRWEDVGDDWKKSPDNFYIKIGSYTELISML